jgi:hypothetical protein
VGGGAVRPAQPATVIARATLGKEIRFKFLSSWWGVAGGCAAPF